MDSTTLISFVLPIYNVELYLEQCVATIEAGLDDRNKDNIEILLIDDGSKDSSPEICDNLQKQYTNIKCFHKKNGGLSDARNYGLSRARGKYVVFIDSDDFLANNGVKSMISAVQSVSADVYIWDSIVVDETGTREITPKYSFLHEGLEDHKVYTGCEFIEKQLDTTDDYVTTVWLGMYARAFLLENNFWFKKGMIHEDELWTPQVLIKATTVFYLGEKLYCYRQRNNSIMNASNRDYTRNLEAVIYTYNILPTVFDYELEKGELLAKIKGNTTKRYLHALSKYQISNHKSLLERVHRLQILINARNIKDVTRGLVLLINADLYCAITKKA